MNVRDYEYIIAVSMYGGIGKASEHLGITPGALSKYVNRIEDELQIRLFDRDGNKLTLTAFGQRYVSIGKEILAMDNLLMNDMKNVREGGKASIRVGIPRGLTNYVMETLFPSFLEQYPEESLFLERGGSKDMSDLLEDGKLDVALVFAGEMRQSLNYRKLMYMPAVLAVPMESDLFRSSEKKEGSRYRVTTNDQWLDEPYIETTNVSIQGIMAHEYFAGKNRMPKTRLCVGDSVTALAAVENGLGNSIVLAGPGQDRMVRFLKVSGMADLGLTLYAATRKKDYLADGVRKFVLTAVRCFEEESASVGE